MPRMLSPYRWPGGRAQLAPRIVEAAKPLGTLIEPFVGGGSVMIAALEAGMTVVVNDLDPDVAAFWSEVFEDPEDLIDLIRTVPASVPMFTALKFSIPDQGRKDARAERSVRTARAFRSLYVNRLSFGGAGRGPIGGYAQSGQWRLDHRYNPESIVAPHPRASRSARASSRDLQ